MLSKLKKIVILKKTFKTIHKFVLRFFHIMSPMLASRYVYRVTTGKKLNIKNPENFNEKLQWLKFYNKDPLIVKCTDKYLVSDYLQDCGCSEILNELIAVYDNTDEIKWDKLPEKFALKTTHGCGGNIICNSKEKLDINKATNELDKWIKTDYSKFSAEWQYAQIKPRIICEKYLEDGAGNLPRDYKIFCFNGRPKLVLVISDRGLAIKLDFLSLEWKRLKIGQPEFESDTKPKKPNSFEKMLEYSQKLAQPFPFVRVDFYDVKGKPVFGEMTFTPAAGVATYYTDDGLKYLGDMLDIEKLVKG